jgi:integrase
MRPCRLCGVLHWNVYEKKPGSGTWYARVWHDGRVVKKKVGTHGFALKVAAKRALEICEGRFFPKPVKPEPPWDPLFARCIDDHVCRHEGALIDREGARRYARYWKDAPETKGKTMRAITRADAERYRARRREQGAPGAKRRHGGASPSTLNKELSFARAVYNDFLDALEQLKPEQRGSIPPNPFASRRGRRSTLYEPEPPTRFRHLGSQGEDEADRLFAALPDIDAKRKVYAAALSGVDRGPMFAWTWADDIDLVSNQVRSWRRKGDGRLNAYWVPMAGDLRRLLAALPSRGTSRWVFPNEDGTGPADAAEFVRVIFKPALRRAGIVDFRWKDLRHTFGSWLRRRDVQLDVIGELLGHRKNSPMTTRYAHLAPDIKHTAVQMLSGLLPGITDQTDAREGASPEASATDPTTDPSGEHRTTAATVH